MRRGRVYLRWSLVAAVALLAWGAVRLCERWRVRGEVVAVAESGRQVRAVSVGLAMPLLQGAAGCFAEPWRRKDTGAVRNEGVRGVRSEIGQRRGVSEREGRAATAGAGTGARDMLAAEAPRCLAPGAVAARWVALVPMGSAKKPGAPPSMAPELAMPS